MFKKFIAILVCFCFLISTLGCGGFTKSPSQGEKEKMARITEEGVFGGVCSGLAYFTGTSPWLWRAGFLISTFCFGFGTAVYLILWLVMPRYDGVPYNYVERTG